MNLLRFITCLFLLLSLRAYSVEAGFPYFEQKVTASDGGNGDYFGTSVSIDRDTAVVGARYSDNDRGSAYIYEFIDDSWIEQQKIIPSNPDQVEYFGLSTSIDNDTILIGAYSKDDNLSAGWVYVFQKSENQWIEQQRLNSSDGLALDFGKSVAISGDTALIGADGDGSEGAAYIFYRSNGSWIETQKLIPSTSPPNSAFGSSVSIDGDTAAVGAPGDDFNGEGDFGSVYFFKKSDGAWVQEQKISPDDVEAYDMFGGAIAIEGDVAVIGSEYDDDNGANSGSAYIFNQINGDWIQKQKLLANDGDQWDYFGKDVSVDGNTIVIGSIGDRDDDSPQGGAYIYLYSDSLWTEKGKVTPFDDFPANFFGYSVSISNDKVLVGAIWDNDKGNDSGASYFYTLDSIGISDQNVPTMGGVGLLALGLSMLGLGAVKLRKE